MKLVLTGGTGFIGSHFINQVDATTDLLLLSRKSHKQHNVLNYDSLFEVSSDDLANRDVFLHLAGIAHKSDTSDADYYKYNTELTLHLAEQAAKAGIKRFVFVSSIGVNGASTLNKPFNSESVANPHNAYANSKYLAEKGLKDISDKSGLEVVIIRPTLVYGSNAPGNFEKLQSLVLKSPALPFAGINNNRSFIAVQNLVDLLMCCLVHPKANGMLILASDGEVISIKTFTNRIAKSLNTKLFQIPVPSAALNFIARCLGKEKMVEQLVGDLAVDSSKEYQILNWFPKYTMEQALKQTKMESSI